MKKAFTLVELLAVIILLGLLGLIIYPTVNGVINNNKQKLHDKQMEELIRHANTYATTNITKLKTIDGARSIVTFTDLYEAGIIQNDKVVDPLNDRELTGCLALIWNASRNQFDIEYTEECKKHASISGTITEDDSPIVATVALMLGNEAVYTTTTDSSGNYSFNNVDTGTYILLASQPLKTKYGNEIRLYDDGVQNMDVKLYRGDYNEDGVVNLFDKQHFSYCYSRLNRDMNNPVYPECYYWKEYDLWEDDDNTITMADSTTISNIHKITEIHYLDDNKISISGKIIFDKNSPYNDTVADYDINSIKLINNNTSYETTVNSDGTFKFTNIPIGSYYIEIRDISYYTYYYRYINTKTDIENINAYLYYGDIGNDGILTSNDISSVELAVSRGYDPSNSRYAKYDLNRDGVINQKDIDLVTTNTKLWQESLQEKYDFTTYLLK